MAWTTLPDVVGLLRRRWDTGAFLSRGTPWEPVGVPLRGPTAAELGSRFGEAQDWVAQWRRVGPGTGRLEYRTVGGRLVGANEVPARLWLDTAEQLYALLGVADDARWFHDRLAATPEPLAGWVRAHPMRVLACRGDWTRLVDTVRWIEAHPPAGMYLRQIDVPAVDTKFVERHRGTLGELLDVSLPADRVDTGRPRSDFAGRYGFGRKPAYVRFRRTGPGFSELTVRTDELVAPPDGVTRVYVVENEITYLAFPLPPDAMVVFGGGYAVTTLRGLPWLAGVPLVYWGDLDTHGFAMLHRLRTHFPSTSSMLMDRATLLDHEAHWVTEPDQVRVHLDLLTPAEAEVHNGLVEHVFGPSVRLEQERIRFSAIETAIDAVPSRTTTTSCAVAGLFLPTGTRSVDDERAVRRNNSL